MVYLDHQATSPLRPEARAALVDAFDLVGNPSSIHGRGQDARRRLEEAREVLAATLGCDPIEIVYTGSGTEAVNLAVKGLFWSRQQHGAQRPRILVADGEHHATLDTVAWLARHEHAMIESIPLDRIGRVDVDALEASIERDPDSVALVTLLWANNEVGTVQPVHRVSAIAAAHSIPVHSDAIAAYGQLRVALRDVDDSVVDAGRATGPASGAGGGGLVAVSVSAHKIGGPVGIGALAVSRRVGLEALVHGGGQQRGLRSGTQDVAAALAFAAVATATMAERDAENARLRALRNRLEEELVAVIPEVVVNGDHSDEGRLPGNLSITLPGAEGDSLLFLLDMAGIAVSTGSACQAGVAGVSHVLLAMGRSEAEARGTLRVSLGHDSTQADVDSLVAALPGAYAQARRAGLTGAARAGVRTLEP